MPRLSQREISEAAALIGRLGGRATSDRKTKANKKNAQRPRPNRRKKSLDT